MYILILKHCVLEQTLRQVDVVFYLMFSCFNRSDVALLVRQNSLHVWKLVVTNTARTLKEILPTLITMLLGCLACNSYDKRFSIHPSFFLLFNTPSINYSSTIHPYIHTEHPLSIHSSTSIPTYTQYIHYPSIHLPPSLHTCTYSKSISIHPLSILSCIHYLSIYFNRQVAASTLGDLVRKLGERILPEIFPMLEKGLKSDLTQERQGVCIGLSEIIRETSRDYMQLYANSLFPTIRLALCDKEQEVRAAAAQTFDSLYTAVGEYMYMYMSL